MIIINLILLASVIFFRSLLFPNISINPTIGVFIIWVGTLISMVMAVKFVLFCLSRRIPVKNILHEAILVLTKKEDIVRHLKRFYEIEIIIVISSAILNRKSTPFWTHFLLDALVLTGFLVYLYSLQYMMINLQAKLMRMYPKIDGS